MWSNSNLPEFGCLRGVKVVSAANSTAAPFGVQLLADYGADVVWVESVVAPDNIRAMYGYAAEVERRNQRNLCLNIPSPEGKEVFLKLIEDADLFVEASKGGQYAKWGLTDEALWEVNPKLVIVHVSGFGQTGVPEYVKRPSYDSIAQAFSGYMDANMNPDTPPYAVGPYVADYITGMFTAIGALAALYRVRETGVGESVDVAQFEIMMRILLMNADALTDGREVSKAGFPAPHAGVGCFECADGRYIQLSVAGAGVIKNCCELIGADEYGTTIPEGTGLTYIGTPEGDYLQKKIMEYLAAHDAQTAHDQMSRAGVAAQRINKVSELGEDPHVIARGTVQEIETVKGQKIKYVGAVPSFKNNPAMTWRSAPYMGMDNEEILGQLGYTDEQIAAMYENKIIKNDSEMLFVYPYKTFGRK